MIITFSGFRKGNLTVFSMKHQNEKRRSGLQWLKEYNEELKKIKDTSPLLLVLCVCTGIEFIGKLLSEDDIDDHRNCKVKFEKALSEFPSLKKYKERNLYDLVRCGLVHRIVVKKGIIISPSNGTDMESATKRLNVYDFYVDFSRAVEDAQNKTDWPNQSATSEYIAVNNMSETGTTETLIN